MRPRGGPGLAIPVVSSPRLNEGIDTADILKVGHKRLFWSQTKYQQNTVKQCFNIEGWAGQA